MLSCFPLLFKISLVCLFVKLFSSFLPLSRQTNDNFGNFFFKFPKASPHYRGKKLVEFDLDLLEITQVSSFSSFCLHLSQILPFPFPAFERYDTDSIVSIFSSLIWSVITLFLIQAFQNATFGVKNTALAQKLVKLQHFDDISIIE